MKSLCFFVLVFSAFGQNCIPPVPLNPNDVQAGELTASSCQLFDSTQGAEYRLTLASRGTLQVTAKGTGFTPTILVRDADGRRVDAASSINRYMEAGVYRVVVNGSALGKFTLTTVFQPEANVLCVKFGRLGLGQAVAGQLSSMSCKLPDGSAFDGWQSTVFGSGTLTVTMTATAFDSFLILRGEDGGLLANSDNGSAGKDAQISIAVSGRETYSIIAGAASSVAKPGSYQLSTTFTPDPDETCVAIRTLTESTQITGSVSTASCNFNLPLRQDSSLFNIYSIHVPESGVAQISIPTSTFTPLLLLLDKDGNSIVEDSESGGLYKPLIRQALKAGDYSVILFNEDSFEGDYTLQYTFSPGMPQPCAVQAMASDQALTGALSGDTSCRVDELLSDTYRITLPSASTIDIQLSSADFTTFLELRDAKDNLLGFGEQTTEGLSAHFKADLPAGTYFLVAASVDLPGTYSLNAQYTVKTIPPCTAIQAVPLNTGFVGKLGKANCTGTGGEPVDYYRFTTTVDGTIALVSTAAELDTHLTLTDNAGKVIRVDDDSYEKGDALIVHLLKAGTYKVEVRGRNNPTSSQYRVDVLFTAGAKPPFCTAATAKIGMLKSSTLTYTGCQYYDNTFADLYQFSVTDGTTPVEITAASSSFDTFLVLTDAKGNVIATDDNGAGGSDARITMALDPGSYFIVLKAAGDPGDSGPYRLSIQQ